MMANPKSTGDGAGSRSSGFRAQLRDASLLDLVQMECFSRVRRVVRLTSGTRVGYLYFDGGRIVHAVSGNRTGEAAAIEILQWEEGSFEPCSHRAWPAVPTIEAAFQGLLMRAALAKDNARLGQLLPLPVARTVHTSEPPEQEAEEASGLPSDAPNAVLLDAQGTLLEGRGAVDDLSLVAAYVSRLGQLVADTLGLDRFIAAEAVTTSGRVMVLSEPNGQLLGLSHVSESAATTIRAEYPF